ncbi:tetratricopeptide repeat protein [Pseudomonas shahriarae]|uniref:tetratricopeptide repeat protein n=1 Tax=Pseudomonas shahriarae TaxID=2745512 RepID=UPI00164878B0|nr:tetratricopeptide repeat protein [Pseudomonas shahriarae]QXH87734.1 tetratricopeptide repeat protein [Pseudomonas shahriarae]
MLDAIEYLHLAIHASKDGNHHAALNYLNTALEHQPDNAAVRYFLAAEHAELGLMDRAHAGMTLALELDPHLDIARFQLGLLNLQQQHVEEARAAFNHLHHHAQDNSLKWFATAYLDVLNEQPENAVEKLKNGLTDCVNPALKADMTRVLASLADTVIAPKSDTIAAPSVFLGAYRENLETP